jgi:hypothetical protein
MPADVEPPELARLLDTAERSRVGDWSLRSALTRYGQFQPVRVGAVLEVLRRCTGALRPHMRRIRKDGHALWAAIDGEPGDDAALRLLQTLRALDSLADTLAGWALDPTAPTPDDQVDGVVGRLSAQLDDLGVPRETRDLRAGPPRRGPRGGAA